MKIALITDTHWGARNDSQHFLEYFTKFHDELFFPYLEEYGIKHIIHLGDIVDRRKYINYITLRRLKDKFINRCIDSGIDLRVTIGNHDVPYKNTNEINSMQELFDQHNVHFHSSPETVTYDGTDILLMPWVNNSNYPEALKAMEETSASIMMGHLEISGMLMMRGMANEHGMNMDKFKKFEMVFSGHFHHKNSKENIHYLGTPYEITWSDYKDPKGFHIFDTDTRELEFIRNPFSMFHKVYYSDEGKTAADYLNLDFSEYRNTYVKVVKQTVNNPYWFDTMLDQLYKAEPVNIQIVEDALNLDIDDGDIVDEAEDTVTILSNYIDSMSNEIPKKRLDNLMRTLYNEAIHLEV
jgi:DNA repair exonuclease SbcCD nuclease subunit